MGNAHHARQKNNEGTKIWRKKQHTEKKNKKRSEKKLKNNSKVTTEVWSVKTNGHKVQNRDHTRELTKWG